VASKPLKPQTPVRKSRPFLNGADFWLNFQRRRDVWVVLNTPDERARIDRAKPLPSAA